MTGAELTEAMITAAMAKAEARVCVGSYRCFVFPDRPEDARGSCIPKGRCKVGGTRRVIVSRGARELGCLAGGQHGAGQAHREDGRMNGEHRAADH
jgi:hypothetical protein